MKRLVLILAALFAAFNSGAQDSNVKLWEEGPLKWSDFYFSTRMGDTTSFPMINYYLKKEKKSKGRYTYKYKDITAALYRNASWVDSAFANDGELKKNQAWFDIMEISAREYRDSLLFSEKKEIDIAKHFWKEAEGMRDNGQEFLVPEDAFDVTEVSWKKAANGFGISLGPAVMIPFKDLARLTYLTPCANLAATGYLGRAMVEFGLTAGQGRARYEYSGMKGSKNRMFGDIGMPYFSASIEGGCAFVDNEIVRIYALAGPGYSQYKLQDYTIGGVTLFEGIGASFKVHNWVFFSGLPSCAEGSIRLKLTFGQIINGYNKAFLPMMNFSVCASLPNWKIVKG